MEENQRKKMLWRIPLTIAILVAIFWGTWYLATGNIPVVSQISWAKEATIQLPFSMSRLWDIPFAFVWALVLIFLFTHKKIRNDEDLISGLFFGLIAGLFFGLGIGLGVGLFFGLSISLSIGLICGLIAGLKFNTAFSLGFGLVFGLSVGLFFGLDIGLGIGLVYGLIAGLFFDLGLGLGVGLRAFFSKSIWKKIGQWFIGK